MSRLNIRDGFAIFGDSVGRGVIYDPESDGYITDRGFVSMLEGHFGIKSANFTRFGQTTSGGLEMVNKKISKLEGVNVIFLEFGGNDCDFAWREIAEDNTADHLPKVSLGEFIDNYKAIIKTLKDQGKTPVILNLPPIDHKLYFNRISRGKNAERILSWLDNDTSVIYRWHESYSYALYNIARSERVDHIDIRSAFCGLELSEYLCPDGIHPNEKGHRLIFERILSEIEK